MAELPLVLSLGMFAFGVLLVSIYVFNVKCKLNRVDGMFILSHIKDEGIRI